MPGAHIYINLSNHKDIGIFRHTSNRRPFRSLSGRLVVQLLLGCALVGALTLSVAVVRARAHVGIETGSPGVTERDGGEMLVNSAGALSTRTNVPRALMAATIEVNSTSDDAVDDGQCTLREAITAANTDTASGMQAGECVAGAGDDTISFAPNVAGTINLTGVLPDIDSNVNIVGPSPEILTVRRDTGGNYRIFMIKSGNTVSISGLTIRNGFVLGADALHKGEDALGGGIFNAGTLTLSACRVFESTVQGGNGIPNNDPSLGPLYKSIGGTGGGGGIYNAGTLTLTGSDIKSNIAKVGGGDTGEAAGAGIYNHGTMKILNVYITQNNCLMTMPEGPFIFKGHGIFNDGTLDLNTTMVSANGLNESRYNGVRLKGGGISSKSGVVTLTDCLISHNSVRTTVWTTIPPIDPLGNEATGQGGGIYIFSGEMILKNTTVWRNLARGASSTDGGHGAGIFLESGRLNLINSTVSNNEAENGGCVPGHTCTGDLAPKAAGGGLYLKAGTANLSNSTITENSVLNRLTAFPGFFVASGLYVDSATVTLHNTIISGNSSGGIMGVADITEVYGAITSKGHNLIGSFSGSSIGWISSDLLGLDAKLGSLNYNGGPTDTHKPLPGSPAIDAGDNTDAPERDQRGMPRFGQGNSLSDIGAVEAVPYPPPTLSVPGDITVEATSANGAMVNFNTSVTHDLDDRIVVGCSALSGSVFQIGDTTITCSVGYAFGTGIISPITSRSFNVKVQDTTGPVISGVLTDINGNPGHITLEATGPDGAVVTWNTPTALDIVDGPVAVVCSGSAPTIYPPQDNNFVQVTSGSTFPVVYPGGPVFVQCIAIDAHGNRSSKDFDVRIVDTTPPVLTLPGDVTVEGTRASGAKATWTPLTATDIVKGSLQVNCSHASGDTFPLGETIVQCSATDGWNNTAQGSFKVTALPSQTPPSLDLPADITAEASNSSGAPVSYSASAKDIAGVTVTINCVIPSGSTFPLDTTTVFCSATDSNDNTSSGSFKVTVRDTTAPVISNLPGNISVEATSPSGALAVWASPVATDLVDQVVAVNCSAASGSIFPLGSTTVTCSATDAYNNRSENSFLVSVQDTTAPALTMPFDINVEATSPSGASATWAAPSATDIVDGSLPVNCSHASGGTFPLGETVVQCSATDTSGHATGGSFRIVVRDTTAPVLTLPGSITTEALNSNGAAVTFDASASDIVDGAIAVVCVPDSGSTFPLGEIPVLCSATDRSGNTTRDTFTVTVRDTAGPLISGVPDDMTLEATGPEGATATWTAPTAIDAVDGALSINCSVASGSIFGFGATTVVCSATDSHANKSEKSFVVTVRDTGAPVLTLPADMTVEATSPGGAVVTFSVSAVDTVDPSITIACSKASGTLFPLGQTTVTCTATDDYANSQALSFRINVLDTTAPAVSCASADGLWHASDVSIPCQASDNGSGLNNPADAGFTISTNTPVGVETDNASTNGYIVCDRALNCVTVNPVIGNKVDKSAPSITLDSPADMIYNRGQLAIARYVCADAGSGVESCTGTVADGSLLDTSSTGTKSFSVTATDKAGNRVTRTITYQVSTDPGAGPSADLSISMTAPKTISAGGTITYTVTVMNLGRDTARSVIVSNEIPLETDFVSTTGSYVLLTSMNDSRLLFNLGDLASGTTVSFTLVLKPKSGDKVKIDNHARLMANTFDPKVSNNEATESTKVR